MPRNIFSRTPGWRPQPYSVDNDRSFRDGKVTWVWGWLDFLLCLPEWMFTLIGNLHFTRGDRLRRSRGNKTWICTWLFPNRSLEALQASFLRSNILTRLWNLSTIRSAWACVMCLHTSAHRAQHNEEAKASDCQTEILLEQRYRCSNPCKCVYWMQ
jgi:hypothetical protein